MSCSAAVMLRVPLPALIWQATAEHFPGLPDAREAQQFSIVQKEAEGRHSPLFHMIMSEKGRGEYLS